jgi:tetratricopeptide (TPR) repeat protein
VRRAISVGCVVAVLGVATLGEGGAAAQSLVVSHLLLAVAVAACALLLREAEYAPARGPAVLWLAFAALAAVGACFAPYGYAAWRVLIELVAFASVFWLATGDPPALRKVLPPAVALLGAAHGLNAVVQKLSGSSRPASTFLNPNHLAAWLAAAALLSGGSMLASHASVRSRFLHGAAVLLELSGIFVTGSRGAALGLVAGAVVLVAASWARLSSTARRRLLTASVVVILGAVVGVTARFHTDDDPYRFHRTRIWRASFQAALQSPLFGTGPGQFAAAAPNLNFPLEAAPLRFERGFRTPHSDLLRTLCEFGFPAALAAIAAVALAALVVFRRREQLTAVERGALAALVGLGAQGLVDDLSTRPAITMTCAALAGLLLARPRALRSIRSRSIAAALCAAVVVLALGGSELAGFIAWRAADGLPGGRLDAEQLAALRRALSWNPVQPDLWRRLADHFVGDGRSWRLPDYAAAREAAEHALRLQPADAFYARAAARVEASACLSILPLVATRDRASGLYDDAQRLARTDATIPLEASRFLLRAGDPAGARRAARKALAIEPHASAPRLWLAEAVLREDGSSGSAEARRLLDEALRLAPAPGEAPSSPYDAALRGVDPNLVERLRGELANMTAP